MGDNRIIRGEDALRAATGLGRTKRQELIDRGEFPPYVKLGVRARAALASDIDAWLTWRAECTAAEARSEEPPPPPKWRLPKPMRAAPERDARRRA